MKAIEEIRTIIAEMKETDFEKMTEAFTDSILEDGKARKSARQMFLYYCKKYNLTEEEYIMWENM